MAERQLEPTEEKALYKCDGCGGGLYSGQRVYQEGLYDDVVGCEECCEWKAPALLAHAPELCPNCGQDVWDCGRVLVTTSGVALACELCGAEHCAADVCTEEEEE